MLKQTLFFTSKVRLSLKDLQLLVHSDSDTLLASRPIEDIGVILLENQQISITLPLLNCLVQNNVAVILCDDKTIPSAMVMPLETNTTQAEILQTQLSTTEPCKKQMWQQLITMKIRNQTQVLNKYQK